MLKPMNEISTYDTDAMYKYLSDFRRNKSHLESSHINSGRVLLRRTDISIEDELSSDEFKFRSRIYRYPGYNFIPYRGSLLDERIKKYVYPSLDVKTLQDVLDTLNSLGFSKNTMDVYFDGEKVNNKKLKLIWEYNNFIFMTEEEPLDVTVIVREYIKDFSVVDTNKIIIDKESKGLYNSSFKLVFANGLKTNNYTETNNEDGTITLTINDDGCEHAELVLMKKYAETVNVPAGSGWIDIRPNSKLAINENNMLVFMNGMLTNVTYSRKGNSYFKINEYGNYNKEIILCHDERAEENVISYGNIDWYKANISSNIPKELNDNTAPTFIKYFTNCNIDTTCNSADRIGKNAKGYLTDIINEVIDYDPENFIQYINSYLKDRDNYTKSYVVSLNEYDYNNYIRNDNSDVPKYANNPETFTFPMVMVTIDNPENRPFKLYVDGVAMFRNIKSYYSMGKTYIYFRRSKVLANSYIEIEVYNAERERYEEEIIVDTTGLYKVRYKELQRVKDLISVYKSTDEGELTEVNFTITDNNEINVGQNKSGLYKIVINNAIIYAEHVINCRFMESISFDVPNHSLSIYDKDYYRLYKNGKLIPSKYWDITFPDDGIGTPNVTVNCKAHMSEQFCLEFNPYKVRELYGEDAIDNYGRIRLDQDTLEGYPLATSIQAIYLNGRKLNHHNIIQNSSNTMELVNVLSTNNFTVLLKEDFDNYTNFPDFKDTYLNGFSSFDDYIKEIMAGSLINNIEQNVLEKDFDIMRDLYWDLYNEYLKNNIVDFGLHGVPDYIAIKYADLVNHEDIIYIDCSEQMNHWMPLDATMTTTENMERITNLYDELLLGIRESGQLTATIADTTDMQKYKELTDKNIIVIDLSHKVKLK